MRAAGIICEYNPFHLGHEKQLRLVRERVGEDTAAVCLMLSLIHISEPTRH